MQRMAYLLMCLFISISVEAKPLRILSWNVFMLPKPIKYSLQVTRTHHIVEKLKNTPHEIVVLQEAFDRGFRSRVRKELREVYPHRYYLGKENLVYPFMSSGVYVLSKIPFKVLDFVFFNWCATADCLASKGAVGLEFESGEGEKFQVVSTHLQSEDRFSISRFHQMNQIHELMEAHQENGVPQLIIGDLNMEGRSEEFFQTQERLGLSHLQLEGDILNTFGYQNDCYETESGKFEWLDHVLVNSQGANVALNPLKVAPMKFELNGNTCELSDHLAVETSIRF